MNKIKSDGDLRQLGFPFYPEDHPNLSRIIKNTFRQASENQANSDNAFESYSQTASIDQISHLRPIPQLIEMPAVQNKSRLRNILDRLDLVNTGDDRSRNVSTLD